MGEVTPVARADLDHAPGEAVHEPAAMLRRAARVGAGGGARVNAREAWMLDIHRFAGLAHVVSSLRRVTIDNLHPAMAGHLEAVTQDAERLRAVWAPDGVLEFPYAPPEMTSRIEGVDRLVAYFDGPRRWADWNFEAVTRRRGRERRLYVAEIHATARWSRRAGRTCRTT